ncbi:HGGxSTG domain-containing protein [Methylobacterium sp. Leaf117]|uniref:HGGxSTG domain-containing protein n=1 Tax=Methylobacterium sp. Leaf117 TaxID=1736260 RepID=UPI000A5F407C|nr:HGGxSTG domain-containing protein [Methylobacterium sp. Leaf117]
MKRGFGTNEPASARQIAWRRSARFKAMGRAACIQFNRARQAAPKCGARKKSDGEPCQNPAMANGRCRLHGGRVPSGRAWHVVQLPPVDTPKFDRKLTAVQKRTRALAKRLAAMTPEQRERYDRWRRTHKPGSASARSAARYRAAQDNAIAEILARPVAPGANAAKIAEVEGFVAQLKREQATAAIQIAVTYSEGIFG